LNGFYQGEQGRLKNNYLTFSKCISCEYVYNRDIHPFVTICSKNCHFCYVCLKKMKGIDLFELCPNKDCTGIFLRDNVRHMQLDENYNKLLNDILINMKEKEGVILKDEIEIIKQIKSEVNQSENETKNNQNNNKTSIISNISPIKNEPTSEFSKMSKITKFDYSNTNTNNSLPFTPGSVDYEKLLNFSLGEVKEESIISEVSKASKLSHIPDTDKSTKAVRSNILECPHCSFPIQYSDGSNMINCNSIFCKFKKYFCRLCNAKLTIEEKKDHFPNGDYKDTCKGK
jgi:hypothetical protein